MKILLQLILPLFFLIIFTLFNSGLEYIIDSTTEYIIKYMYNNYIFVAAPHYIALLLSQIIKKFTKFKPATLYLLTVANIILVLFISYILLLKAMNFVDLSILWIFYPIISAVSIIITLFIINLKKDKREELSMKQRQDIYQEKKAKKQQDIIDKLKVKEALKK